ncbi:hypothetical protein C5B96_01970 [Subtercola sp. Z020]|uniref:hypothetical protein n=1 Tax=Subtercola sp. Z020 TaxID=2080582 RepID=UPI000CE74D7D|nr:hypothetical protein [Subtercola sp. Z020]PPF88960.1 hypothetical protein C5B96_01970 [Subtercola sp. Z020]
MQRELWSWLHDASLRVVRFEHGQVEFAVIGAFDAGPETFTSLTLLLDDVRRCAMLQLDVPGALVDEQPLSIGAELTVLTNEARGGAIRVSCDVGDEGDFGILAVEYGDETVKTPRGDEFTGDEFCALLRSAWRLP